MRSRPGVTGSLHQDGRPHPPNGDQGHDLEPPVMAAMMTVCPAAAPRDEHPAMPAKTPHMRANREGAVHGRDASRPRAPCRTATPGGPRSDGRELRLSNLDEDSWPDEGYTKGDLVTYYANAASLIAAPPGRTTTDDEAHARRHRRAVLLRQVGPVAHARLARAMRRADRGREDGRDRLPHDRRQGGAALRGQPRVYRVPSAAFALRGRRRTPTTCSSISSRWSRTRTRTR